MIEMGLTEILQAPGPMPMSMELLIAADAVGMALLIAVAVPIAMEPMEPDAVLITILDCMSMVSALCRGLDQ